MSPVNSNNLMKNEVLDRAMSAEMNRVVLFTNFSGSDFSCKWDSKEFNFKPGESRYMEYWRARHFGKHLVNQVLSDTKQYPNGANSQSPKEVDGVWKDPIFLGLFAKAVSEQSADSDVDAIDLQARAEKQEGEPKVKRKPGPKPKVSEPKKEEEEEFGDVRES